MVESAFKTSMVYIYLFFWGVFMKERIEEKLKENIERILSKEELDRFDVAILKDELCKIKREEDLEKFSKTIDKVE